MRYTHEMDYLMCSLFNLTGEPGTFLAAVEIQKFSLLHELLNIQKRWGNKTYIVKLASRRSSVTSQESVIACTHLHVLHLVKWLK